eukprot:254651_1
MDKSSIHQPSSKSQQRWMIHDYLLKQTQFVLPTKTLNISWNIDNKLKQRMKASSHNTIFRSNDKQMKDDSLFIIAAKTSKPYIYSYPQMHFYIATNLTNNLNYALRKHIDVKYTLTCYELNINQTNTFTFDENHTDTSKQKLNTKKLAIRKCDANLITVNAKIQIPVHTHAQTTNISNQNNYGRDTCNTMDRQWDIVSCNSEYENIKRECIVIGYINCIERMLSKNIANDIKNVCLLYYMDENGKNMNNIIQNTMKMT